MSSTHDHAQSGTDLLPPRPAPRHRTPRHPVPTAQGPQNLQKAQNVPLPPETPGMCNPHVADPATPHTCPGTFTPATEPPTPRPALPAPRADVVTIRHSTRVEHELVLARDATAADVTTAMIMIPPGAGLVGHRAGTDRSRLSLLFHEPPEDSAQRHAPAPTSRP